MKNSAVDVSKPGSYYTYAWGSVWYRPMSAGADSEVCLLQILLESAKLFSKIGTLICTPTSTNSC